MIAGSCKKINDFLVKSSNPTIFHITQYKCGSQWIAEILKACSGRRYELPKENSGHVKNIKLKKGSVYPTVYLSKTEFESVMQNNSHLADIKPFVVTRDMRDVMVSFYFSLKRSHVNGFTSVNRYRPILESLDTEAGLLHLVDKHIGQFIDMQLSWLNSEYPVFYYEDLLDDEQKVIREILTYCEISLPEKKLEKIIHTLSFSNLSGRERGSENTEKHLRKGISGDWKNYFTPAVKDAFKSKFGEALIQSGYEKNNDW